MDEAVEREVDDDFARFGLTRPQPKIKPEDDVILVEPENVAAVTIFFMCDTQWRNSGFGLLGLDYVAVESVMRIERVKDRRDCLSRIRDLEAAALAEIQRRQDKARKANETKPRGKR